MFLSCLIIPEWMNLVSSTFFTALIPKTMRTSFEFFMKSIKGGASIHTSANQRKQLQILSDATIKFKTSSPI